MRQLDAGTQLLVTTRVLVGWDVGEEGQRGQ